ncbi:DUF2752 domain-containing protein [Winogradskyella sp. APC 3343]|uniref:DUF2752 domain-containing protein n=2 Tax=Winogradskyella bathintestinalis TaxID=3035208 RepID=A0ABT7ZTS9_9FLAO|nr:DUF2752 domain-containing protein [Winogradskyella bathintestinalis]MDN3492128.1 DUF2752 domain-containing protein [Winogradskyella bathintestinalis]
MLPCLWKQTFNIDCMGCGMQRSIALILHGDLVAAFYMYPAIYSLIALFSFLLLHLKFHFKNGHRIILGLFLLNISIIVISFIIKTFLIN